MSPGKKNYAKGQLQIHLYNSDDFATFVHKIC